MNAAAHNVVLVRAKMESFKAVAEAARPSGEVDLGALFKVRLGIIEPLIGQLGAAQTEAELKIASLPRTDELKDVYVLGEKLPDGKFQALQWSYVTSGLCIRHDLAKAYSIEDDLQKLRTDRRITWDADCDW
jgi:hypothetical protein